MIFTLTHVGASAPSAANLNRNYLMQNLETWMPEARQIAAQCWCDPETEKITMNVELAEAMARRIAVWMKTSAEYARSLNYYQNLVIRCGVALGIEARTCDDGTISEDILCSKVPELVEALCLKCKHKGGD